MKFKALSLLFNTKKMIAEANQFAADCGMCHHTSRDPRISADLKDIHGPWQLTKDGFLVSGRILEEQFNLGTASPALPFYMALWAAISVVSGLLSAAGLGSLAPALIGAYFVGFWLFFGPLTAVVIGAVVLAPTLAVGAVAPGIHAVGVDTSTVLWWLNLLPAVLPLLYYFFTTRKQAQRLALQGAMHSGAVIASPRSKKNKARFDQAAADIKDTSHFIRLGTAKGRLSANGDEFAPDSGMPFGLKTKDLSKHCIAFGSTGTGKTSGALRPIFFGFIEEEKSTGQKNGGLYLDGKAQFASDVAKYLDAVIHPSTVKNFNVLENIRPEIFARTLQTINLEGKETGNSSYFNGQARNLIYYGSLFHDAFVGMGSEKNNLSTRLKILSQMLEECDANGNHPIVDKIKLHSDFSTGGTLINDAVNKFMAIQTLATETKTSIFSTAESWIIPLMQSEALRPWADCTTSDIKFDDILYGKKYGFNLPEAEFGIAGLAITSLMKARLFQLITLRNKKRKELGQSKVILMIDEAQRVIDKGDIAMIAVAREWDLVFIYATQNIESLEEKFGKPGTAVILDSCRSKLFFKGTEQTLAYAVEAVGKDIVWIPQAQVSRIHFGLTSQLAMSNPTLDPGNPYRSWMKFYSFSVFNWIFGGRKRLNFKTGTAERNIGMLVSSEKPDYLVRTNDIQLLNEPFTALAVFDRAGVSRRDIIKTQPLDAEFKPFALTDKSIEEEFEETA